MWSVVYLREAEVERSALPKVEVAAMIHADAKLRSLGPALGYPQTSAVRGELGLRELPATRRSQSLASVLPQSGTGFVIAAVGPEAQVDPRGFRRACQTAVRRLAQVEEG